MNWKLLLLLIGVLIVLSWMKAALAQDYKIYDGQLWKQQGSQCLNFYLGGTSISLCNDGTIKHDGYPADEAAKLFIEQLKIHWPQVCGQNK